MPYMYRLLGLAAILSTLVAASPVFEHPQLDSRDELVQLEERQDANTDSLETDAATDPLRDGKPKFPVWYKRILTLLSAIDYTSIFSAQATATYSAVFTGASPSNAVLASVTAVPQGNGAPGVPPDPSEQGQIYNIDHILELQFVVGAFQVNPRPYVRNFPRGFGTVRHGERDLADTNHKKHHGHYINSP